MVYTGKPSRGCQTCKSRRIKCDEERPTCSQCRKSGRACPGYPDEFDLIFRNENVAVARRAKRASSSKNQSSLNSTSSFSSSSSSRSPSSQDSPGEIILQRSSPCDSSTSGDTSSDIIPFSSNVELQAYAGFLQNALPPSLSPSDEAKAMSFFINNFVLVPREADTMRGFLEHLMPIYNGARITSALHDATHAVALSAFGSYPDRRALRQEARVLYGQALQKVGTALKDPKQAKSDEVLLSILLFSLYEAIMSTAKSESAWNQHVDGAVALVKLRGTEQFKNPLSYNIFRAVRSMMLTNCIQRGKPVEEFPGEGGWMGDGSSNENAANRLTMICIELPAIRLRFEALQTSEKNNETSAEAISLMETVKVMDANLHDWALTLPDSWNYKIVSIGQEIDGDIRLAEVWPGPQHAYQDVFVSSIVNDYRVSRIFCQSVVVGCLSFLGKVEETGDPQAELDLLNARFVTQQMVDDICASVPFNTHYQMQMRPRTPGQDDMATQALGAYFLAWPLYICARAAFVPERQREWLFGRLIRVGREFGLDESQIQTLSRRHVLTNATSFL